MGAALPIDLGHGVQVYAERAEGGWRAVGLTALGSMAGTATRLRLTPPSEITERRFVTTDELAAATLRWLSTPQRSASRLA